MLLWRALTGVAELLISCFCDEELLRWDDRQRIFDVLAQGHNHISEIEDQDDFDSAIYKLHRERKQTLLKFANVARAAYLKHDIYGHPLPDRAKGHLENHIMAKTNGSRNFSDLLEAIQILARRPMNQVSSSYPSFDDDGAEGADVTEYYDMASHNDADDDGYSVSGYLRGPNVRGAGVGL